jgi:hypothetical protein
MAELQALNGSSDMKLCGKFMTNTFVDTLLQMLLHWGGRIK